MIVETRVSGAAVEWALLNNVATTGAVRCVQMRALATARMLSWLAAFCALMVWVMR